MTIQKIKTGCVEDNAITTSKFLNQSVTIEKLATSGTLPALDGSQLTGIVAGATITKDPNDPAVDTNPADGVGALWLNTSQGYLWVCTDSTTDANVWQSASCGTSNVLPFIYQGTQFGYVIGGFNGGASGPNTYLERIEKYAFASANSVNNIGDLSDGARYNAAGFKHITNAFFAGGIRSSGSGNISSITKFAYANETQTFLAGNLVATHFVGDAIVGMSSETHGYAYAGKASASMNTLERFSMVSDGDAQGDIGGLGTAHETSATGNSETTAYLCGGSASATTFSAQCFSFTFATNSVQNNIATLSTGRNSAEGTSSTSDVYVAGGHNGNYVSIIDRISFASGNQTTTHGNLSVAQSPGAGCSETNAGYYGGGNFVSGGHTTSRTDILKINFSSNTQSTDHGTLEVPSYGPADSHV